MHETDFNNKDQNKTKKAATAVATATHTHTSFSEVATRFYNGIPLDRFHSGHLTYNSFKAVFLFYFIFMSLQFVTTANITGTIQLFHCRSTQTMYADMLHVRGQLHVCAQNMNVSEVRIITSGDQIFRKQFSLRSFTHSSQMLKI